MWSKNKYVMHVWNKKLPISDTWLGIKSLKMKHVVCLSKQDLFEKIPLTVKLSFRSM